MLNSLVREDCDFLKSNNTLAPPLHIRKWLPLKAYYLGIAPSFEFAINGWLVLDTDSVGVSSSSQCFDSQPHPRFLPNLFRNRENFSHSTRVGYCMIQVTREGAAAVTEEKKYRVVWKKWLLAAALPFHNQKRRKHEYRYCSSGPLLCHPTQWGETRDDSRHPRAAYEILVCENAMFQMIGWDDSSTWMSA